LTSQWQDVAAEKTPVSQSQKVVLKCISLSFNSVLRLFVLTQEGAWVTDA